MSPWELSLRSLRDRLAEGELSAEETTRAFLDRIAAKDRELGAFLLSLTDSAIERALSLDRLPRERARAPSWRSHRRERHHRRRGHPHHRGLAHSGRLRLSLQRDGNRTTFRRRGGHPGKDEPRRVRDGLVHRELRVPDHEEPVEPGPGPGRLERRIGGGGCRASRASGARNRHRRLDPPARRALRRRRAEADLRPGLAIWPGSVRLLLRSDRTHCEDRGGRSAPPRDPGGRGSKGLHLLDSSGAPVYGRDRPRCQVLASRYSAGRRGRRCREERSRCVREGCPKSYRGSE